MINLSQVGNLAAAREVEVGTAGTYWIFDPETKATIASKMKVLIIII